MIFMKLIDENEGVRVLVHLRDDNREDDLVGLDVVPVLDEVDDEQGHLVVELQTVFEEQDDYE